MKSFENVRGMRDFLPDDLTKRKFVEGRVRDCFRSYGYEEVETPVIEYLDLLSARAGEEIRHRMFAFKDLGGRNVALRPEMTASIARVIATKLRLEAKPLRIGYIANCFRYDNPQMGRYREFWQAGFELFGSRSLEADAEIITVNNDLMKRLGFSDFFIKIGDVRILRGLLGSERINESDQSAIMGLVDKRKIKSVISFLEERKVSNDCLKTVKKILNLKGTDYQRIVNEARKILTQSEASLKALNDLETVINLAQLSGVETPFLLDVGFARGLEYYTGMIYEIFVSDLGIALGGGGRYDGLVELFGGEHTPAVGCAPGIDRIVLAMEKKNLFPASLGATDKVLVIPVSEALSAKALEITAILRSNGISAQNEVTGRSIGAALSYADKKGYSYTIIFGPRELEKNCVTIRFMKTKEQKEVLISEIADNIKHS
ncbi:MAG: histidyl-tRNA synthetase [Thermoproteota archaeon]|nr:histidyl-tRNA synthetase [Thermoproteota archaeon]